MDIKAKAQKVETELTCLLRTRTVNNQTRARYAHLKEQGIPLKKLSSSQKAEIKKVWNGKVNDFSTHELLYSIKGEFNPYFCSEKFHFTKFDMILNNKNICHVWADKNYSDKYFPEVPFPKAIVRNIHGIFYDADYNLINKENAVKLISDYDRVCIKPSIGCAGQGVDLVCVDEKIGDVLDRRKSNFIVQEVLEQYAPIKALNPSSVNIVRICSLFLNGKVSVLSASLRCGAQGAFNDNSITADGKGMFVVGVDLNTGKLKDTGYYSCGVSLTESPNGVPFAGLQLPNFDKALELTSYVHSKMPFAAFVGFDVAFSAEGNPVIMEYNLTCPGVFYYQLVNGPLFGDRTQEVIDYYFR